GDMSPQHSPFKAVAIAFEKVAERIREAIRELPAVFSRVNIADKETSEAQRALAAERLRKSAR
ncbi:MAG: hypothetical protein J0L53_18470, partial [Spirochaetes bacterium]|nr:hypothetical protein [Spirochaetota bacterium]